MKINQQEDGEVSFDCPVSSINVDTTNSVSDTTENGKDISIRTVIYSNGGKAVITTNNATKKFNFEGENVLASIASNGETPEAAILTIKSK
ncbi:hypothetical protein Xsto_03781 [Xenorhabdus stockiae]|uniref:Uncharacterized protein n=1 Tax=Xenorhabdus stockiae TaxID=351614 RepID=A0A2D0KBC4_9GAMM|nr:hypothetical protein [Xenorhabdus stockiae]PHM60670.1 hypothetical protein Xsto_03781 [Xenorhabdus stockiae]